MAIKKDTLDQLLEGRVPHVVFSKDGLGTVGNLVRGAGFPSGSDEAIAEHDGELGLSLGPFAGRHFPLL
ncbi:MAG: hypothetical protein WCF81_09995, partial [Roseiarcus sp.]